MRRLIRESVLMSKAELVRKANVSSITISRIEQGLPCRLKTKRKIIKALGYKLSARDKIFPENLKTVSLIVKKERGDTIIYFTPFILLND